MFRGCTAVLRRSFITGLGSALAAPAIVRAELIMPVKSLIVSAPRLIARVPLSEYEILAEFVRNIEPIDTPLLSILESAGKWRKLRKRY